MGARPVAPPPAPQAQDAAVVRPTSAVPAPKLILWPPPRRDRRYSRAARQSSGRTAVPSPPGRAGRLCRRPAGSCRWGGPSLPTAKYRHRAVFGISVQQRCWGLGLDSIMRDALLSAPAAGAIRSSSWKSMPATNAVWPCIKNLVFLYGARPATTCYRGTAVSAHLVVRHLRCAYTATPL